MAAMVVADEPKAKQPHKDGLSCVNCGAKKASKWRGINGDHCSLFKCKQAAAAQRAAAANGGQQAGGELVERVEELESLVAALQKQFSRLAQEQHMAGSKRRLPLAEVQQALPLPAPPPAAVKAVDEKRLLRKHWSNVLFGLREAISSSIPESDLKARFEAAVGLPAGAVDASDALSKKWKQDLKAAEEDWADSMQEEKQAAEQV